MTRNATETLWDGCPKCGEWVRFDFLSQTCPCGWSLEGGHADGFPTLSVAEFAFEIAGTAIIFVGSFALAADLLGYISVPAGVWWLSAGALLCSVVGNYLAGRAKAATIGGGRRGN